MALTVDEQQELAGLEREMFSNSCGDRPHGMAAGKLRRLIELRGKRDDTPYLSQHGRG